MLARQFVATNAIRVVGYQPSTDVTKYEPASPKPQELLSQYSESSRTHACLLVQYLPNAQSESE